ncbi:MAG: Triosephosphate isomerase [Legionellaceae bacterium]
MRKRFVIGNWKMNGDTASITDLLANLKINYVNEVGVAVLPPYLYLSQVITQLKNTPIQWGAQNVSDAEIGAYTGEISAKMLHEFQCSYVLVGHSERRILYKEDDELIAKKFITAKKYNLTPVLCIGETKAQRDQNQTINVLKEQLTLLLEQFPEASAFEQAIIAYEPIWAIGSGNAASADEAQEIHASIRDFIASYNKTLAVKLPLIYGGSVTSKNAKSLFDKPDIDGGLIGGASLNSKEFMLIYEAAVT